MLAAAIQLWRRRPSALARGFVVGGAGFYLCAMDVLYDLEHGIYTKGQGGVIELAINLATAASSIGVVSVGWHFRLERSLGTRPTKQGAEEAQRAPARERQDTQSVDITDERLDDPRYRRGASPGLRGDGSGPALG